MALATIMRMRKNSRPTEYWNIAKMYAKNIQHLFVENAESVIATTSFVFQGPHSVGIANDLRGGNWGHWVRTKLQSHGENPWHDIACTIVRGWTSYDSYEVPKRLLDCFDLTLRDIDRLFGLPVNGQISYLDLPVILKTAFLRPNLPVSGQFDSGQFDSGQFDNVLSDSLELSRV